MNSTLKRTTIVCLFITAIPAFAAEVAKVNGKVLTEKDLDLALSQYNDGQRRSILQDENSKARVVDSLVAQALLEQEARKAGLDSSKDFKSAKDFFERQYLANALIEQKLGPKMGATALKAYYNQNKSRYSTETVNAYHILISDREKAKKVMEEVKKPGADFLTLAEKHSEDPSAKTNRGNLGYFTRDQMAREFSDAAFTSKVGDIVGPVKTTYGYHIIKVVDRRSGKALNFDEVELRVRNDLREQLITEYVSGLRSKAKLEVK